MDEFTKIAKILSEESRGEAQQKLIAKIPLDFNKMSMKIHSDFDQLYQDAIEEKDREHSLKQVSSMMLNCVACHSVFSLKEKSVNTY